MSVSSPSEQQLKALICERRRIRLHGIERFDGRPGLPETGVIGGRVHGQGQGGESTNNHAVGDLTRIGLMDTPPGPQPRATCPPLHAQSPAPLCGEEVLGGQQVIDATSAGAAQARAGALALVLAGNDASGHQEGDEDGPQNSENRSTHFNHRRNSRGMLESAVSAGPPTPATARTGAAQGFAVAGAGAGAADAGAADADADASAKGRVVDNGPGRTAFEGEDGSSKFTHAPDALADAFDISMVDVEGIVQLPPVNAQKDRSFGRQFKLPTENVGWASMSGRHHHALEPPPQAEAERGISSSGSRKSFTFDGAAYGAAGGKEKGKNLRNRPRGVGRSDSLEDVFEGQKKRQGLSTSGPGSPTHSSPYGSLHRAMPTSPKMRTATNRLAVESIKSGNMDDVMMAHLQEKAHRASRIDTSFSISGSRSPDRTRSMELPTPTSPDESSSSRGQGGSPRRGSPRLQSSLSALHLSAPVTSRALSGYGYMQSEPGSSIFNLPVIESPDVSAQFQRELSFSQVGSKHSLRDLPAEGSERAKQSPPQAEANPPPLAFPSHIKALFSKPASSVTSAFNVHRIKLDTTILDAMRILADTETVIVDGWVDCESGENAKDMIWNRSGFLEVAAAVEDATMPVMFIVEQVCTIPTVLATEPLEVVWKCMVAMGVDQVGTLSDDGRVTGVVLFSDLYKLVLEETESRAPDDFQKWGIGDRTFNKLGDMDQDGAVAERAKGVGIVQDIAITWSESFFTTLLSFYLLCMEIACIVQNATVRGSDGDVKASVAVSGMVLSVFCIEAFVRVIAYQRKLLDGSMPLETLDQIVTWVAVILFVLGLTSIVSPNVMRGAILFRGIRALRIIRLGNRLRKLVGRDRRRYTKNGFDLDLTYVTPGVIAMSVPSAGSATNYRNPVHEVARFFNTIHNEKYHIFNLCPERDYDHNLFHGRVSKIKVQDHNPITITDLVNFVEKVQSFIESDPDCVIAVHCKGGKGRTGTAISTWLLYSNFVDTADEAMKWFASQRTAGKDAKIKQGVTGVSQQRYVRYMESIFNDGGYHSKRLILDRIVIHTTMKMDSNGGCDPWFLIEENCHEVFDWRKGRKVIEHMKKNTSSKEFDLRHMGQDGQMSKGLPLVGDVRISMYDHDKMRERLACYFWFHTGFVENNYLCLTKSDIDMASTDKRCRVFHEDFRVEMFFSSPISRTADNFREVAPPSFRVLERARKDVMSCEMDVGIHKASLHPAIKAFRDQSSAIFKESARQMMGLGHSMKNAHLHSLKNDHKTHSGDIMMGPDGPTPIGAHRKGLGHVFDEAREFLEDSGRRFRRIRGSGSGNNSGHHGDISQLASVRKATLGSTKDEKALHSPTVERTVSLDDGVITQHKEPKESKQRRPSVPDLLLSGIGIGSRRSSSNATPVGSSNATPVQMGSSDPPSQPSRARPKKRRPSIANIPRLFGSGGRPPVLVDEIVGSPRPEREEMC